MNFHKTKLKSNLQQFRLNLLGHLRQYGYWYFLLIGMQLAILAYYWFEWRTFLGFVKAIDHSSQFMQDFVDHYYPMSRQILHVSVPISKYYYTSFFAILLIPISLLPPLPAVTAWGVIQFACFATLCIISARGLLKLSPLGMLLFVGLCTTSFPVLHNIKWGQVSILMTACIVGAFYASNRNKRVLAGILLAFAAAIKYYPAFFIIYFILKRDIRACIAFGLAAFTFYFAFPATVLGFSNWFEFEKAATFAINNSEWVTRDVNSQYIVHVGLRWFAIIFDQPAGDTLAQILKIVGYSVALSCILLAWLLQRKGIGEKYGLSMVSIFMAIPFVIKTSWPHYFVYLPVCQMAVLSYFNSSFHTSDIRGKALRVLPLLSMLLSSVFFFNLFPNWDIYNSYGMLFLANFILWVAVYATVIIKPVNAIQQGYTPQNT